MSEQLVRVKVCDGFAVYDGEEQRSGGAELDVPADLAQRWAEAGYVEKVPRRSGPRRPPPQRPA